MPNDAPRRASGSLGTGESDRTFAAVALTFGCVLAAIIFLFWFAGERTGEGGTGLVTVTGMPSGGGSASNPSSARPLQPAGDTPGRRLGERLVLRPHVVNGQLAGYIIDPASDARVLAKARLRAGDKLIDVDGRPLDPARLKALGDELSVADRVEVTFEREGHLRKRVIDLTATADRP